jgi:hypothetical protein
MKKIITAISKSSYFCLLTVHVPPAPISSFHEAFSHLKYANAAHVKENKLGFIATVCIT